MKKEEPEFAKVPWKDAETMPRYTVGQLSDFFDIHPQSLRYFETVKLIRPVRDETNGRRLYSNRDMFEVIERLKYKNLGFTVKETENILKKDSLNEENKWIQECTQRLQKEQEKLLFLQRGLARLKEAVDRMDLLLDRCIYQRRPVFYLHLHHINGEYVDSPGAVEARKMFIDLMPLSFYLFEIPVELDKQQEEYRWNVAMEEDVAEKTGFSEIPGVKRIESEECIYTIFRIIGSDGVNSACYDHVLQFIRQNEWKAYGNVYGSFITALNQHGQSERYFEAWIPICKQDPA